MSDTSGLYALCDYGVPPAVSAELMSKYASEDEIPLSEFDAGEYKAASGL